ncbi:unnamed protein product [Arabis nemorensis]|uniref:Uncharacterized protein n=1 Tax=Arabis nemorensis TaxID=586526 RepID=A0A565C3S9_9BRAS|nr:unnamed protein product [Arabis nemorensis]
MEEGLQGKQVPGLEKPSFSIGLTQMETDTKTVEEIKWGGSKKSLEPKGHLKRTGGSNASGNVLGRRRSKEC